MCSNAELPNGQLNAPSSQTKITDLNADCLLKIFRYLDVENMAIASDACQRFRESASEAFKYEWKGKTVWLSNQTREHRLESTAILRNFGSQLQKIHIVFGETRNLEFLNMIIEKCSRSELTEVDVSGQILSKANVCRLKNKFTNLRSLGFEITTRQTDDSVELECIEQHFSNLDQLRLFGNPLKNLNVQQIMSLNPQVKSLSLLYRNHVENATNLLEWIDQYVPQLEQLELHGMSGSVDNIGYQPKFLKNLKRLKFFDFGCAMNMRHLSISNEKVEELELEEGTCDEHVVDFICQYKEVKKLAIRYVDYQLDYKHLLKLGKHLPKLTELEISSSCSNLNHQAIIDLVLGSKQLVKLVIQDIKRKDVLADLMDLKGKLDPSKWSVDCCPSNKELIIRSTSNLILSRTQNISPFTPSLYIPVLFALLPV